MLIIRFQGIKIKRNVPLLLEIPGVMLPEDVNLSRIENLSVYIASPKAQRFSLTGKWIIWYK